jgi:TupA-like ATPgrasp
MSHAEMFATMVRARRDELWTTRRYPHTPHVCEHETVSASDDEARWKCCDHWQRKLSNKLNAKAFAQRHGVQVAQLLWNGPVDRIPYGHLPGCYVLKLSNGTGGEQVIAVSEGYDALHKVRVDTDSLRRRVSRMFGDVGDPDNQVLVEEFIGCPARGVPLDYKFFCFYGRVEVLYISNRNTGTLSWFDDEWNAVEETIHGCKPRGPEGPPPAADRLIECAELLARAYEYPFVRIDLYCPAGSVVFGEFTHTPFGGDDFTDFGNRVLGDLWVHPELTFQGARRLCLKSGIGS